MRGSFITKKEKDIPELKTFSNEDIDVPPNTDGELEMGVSVSNGHTFWVYLWKQQDRDFTWWVWSEANILEQTIDCIKIQKNYERTRYAPPRPITFVYSWEKLQSFQKIWNQDRGLVLIFIFWNLFVTVFKHKQVGIILGFHFFIFFFQKENKRWWVKYQCWFLFTRCLCMYA